MPLRIIDGDYVADITLAGKRIRKTLPATTQEEAEAQYETFARGGILAARFPVPRSALYRAPEMNELRRKTKERAEVRDIPFDLTQLQVQELFNTAGHRCQLTGLPFNKSYKPAGSTKRPFAASLDRIDCTLGYTIVNVRLVCVAVNVALGEWGYESLKRIALAIALRERMI